MKLLLQNSTYLIALLQRLGGVMLLFLGVRVIFYFENHSYLPIDSLGDLVLHLFYALRFDLSSIIYINSLLLIGMLLPLQSRRQPFYQRILKIIFLATNGIALIFELTDVVYFPFNLRRIIYSDFALFQNTAEMIPGYLLSYWWLCLIWIGLLIILASLFRSTKARHPETYRTQWQIFIFLGSLTLLVIGARGGFQLRPVSPTTAFEYVDDARLAPLITNTTMSLLFSSQLKQLTEKNYFDSVRSEEIFNLRRQYHDRPPTEKRNVFIIVLESFGTEHIGPKTPFLDSLLNHSLVVNEAYANGLRSTQGILAITASIPALMDKPLMFSAYQTNRIDGIAKVLGEWGYTSGFFHGANPGSMEFERFAKSSGFDHYIDRDDFGDDSQYDGRWGIWDEPFFDFTAEEVDQYPEPFLALLFSLTSHHPYNVPDWFTNKYPEEDPQVRANRYTDYALQEFFDKIRKLPWFQNTLFVITADHTGRSKQAFYQGNQGRYRIPIAIYDPKQEIKGSVEGLAQQTDIMPTVLDLIGYDKAFAAFGNSILDSTRTPMVYYFNGIWYQAINQSYFYDFDGLRPQRVFNYRKDSTLSKDVLGADSIPLGLIDTLKAIIQVHNKGMLNNQLYLQDN